MRLNLECMEILVISCAALALRSIISLGSYSGKSTPPMFGDYEAQRHWQELTLNLPAKQWYTNSSNNDLLYWGLDYPPLTAYHSYGLGLLANLINASYTNLHESRGFESQEHKSFMRWTVLMADLAILIPACIVLALALKKVFALKQFAITLSLLLLYPGLIVIDNGHFQYNNISLGIMLLAVAAILRQFNVLAAFLFSLSLNYKQMELYHALPFFVYLLRSSFSERSQLDKFTKLMKISLVTASTFAVLWLPWLSELQLFKNTLSRLFPFNRGVFEDKVANIWCSLNVIFKLKSKFDNSQMALICLSTTLLAVLPINLHIFKNCSRKTFLFSLFNTALCFFLFSYQVHEKSILIAAIPMACLITYMPFYVILFMKISLLSMLPLLIKDNLCVQYFAVIIGFSLVFKYFLDIQYSTNAKVQNILSHINVAIDIVILLISCVAIFAPNPARFPHLWSLFISIFCCAWFVLILFVSVLHQFSLNSYLDRLLLKIVSMRE